MRSDDDSVVDRPQASTNEPEDEDEEGIEETEPNDDDDDDDDNEQEDMEEEEDPDDNDDKNSEEDEATEDSGSDHSESDDSDDSSSSEEESHKKIITEDGREISEYEMLRLERIRRNKERLAALGLQGKAGGGVLGPRQPPKKKKKKTPPPHAAGPRRSSLSRRSKGKITHYATSLPSVREMLKGETQVKRDPNQPTPKPKKTKDPTERMDKILHTEFRRLRSQKTHALRQAERDHRAAAKEVKFWTNYIEKDKRKEMRQQKRQENQGKEEEKVLIGGKTPKQVLKEIDERLEELEQAAEEYDEKYEAEARLRRRQEERFEMDERMRNLEAFERYPKILKETTSILNTVLVERAPKDPPPPRRSKRAGEEDEKLTPHTKKKAKKDTEEEETWTEQAPISAVNLPTAEEESGGTPVKALQPVGKKRKRGVRNVGGWVSPDFAAKISRTWLEQDTPPPRFELSTFVPQVGDTLLYYPRGHYEFLAEYPDVLGKKTRQITRVPLWERLKTPKDAEEAEEDQTHKWCTEDWVNGFAEEADGGRYPILCTVQNVCAEFPPDPNTKVVKSKEGADGETIKKVFFKKSKGSTNAGKGEISKLRLSVTLKPLSPILPGLGLELPPTFSVVTFPSKKKPFLIPFAWAYSLCHSMQFGTTVVDRSDPESVLRISKVDVPEGVPNGGCIDTEKAGSILGLLGDEKSRKQNLAKILADDPRQLPLSDALVVLSTLETKAKKEAAASVSTEGSAFVDLVCETLPVWDSLTVTSKDVYDRKLRTTETVSPWDVAISQKTLFLNEPTPDSIAEFSSDRDESLRIKIEAVIDEVIRDHFNAVLFVDPITEDIAPSYFCAVPVGMWMSRIQKRLKGTSRNKGCLYRSVGAVLNDVSGIVENCLLYNSPESEVVDAASEVTKMLKDGITRVVREHNKLVDALQKADEDRRRQVMQLCGTGADASSKVSISVCRVRKPFKQAVYSDWLQEFQHKDSSQCSFHWIPQAGDDLEYSRSRHSAFVKAHHAGLELDQCEVLPMPGNSDEAADLDNGITKQDDNDWIMSRVAWTKAVFPRLLSKKEADAPAFSTNSTLLAIGITPSGEETENPPLHVVFWRPCMFNFEKNSKCGGHCEVCKLALEESFLRKASSGGSETTADPCELSEEKSKAIEVCFSLLKKRILNGVPPAHMDEGLSRSNIKQGFEVASTRHGLKSLPSFENIFKAPVLDQHGTRKVERFKAPPSELPECGYLVHWMAENQKSKKDSVPKQHESVSPWPKLCLELIRLRLLSGFYRFRMALENDLVEAYSSACLLLLSEEATQKKSPLSVKKVTKMLASLKGRDTKQDESNEIVGAEDQRIKEWAERLRPIRELYSAALTAVSDMEKFERLNGLHVKVMPVFEVKSTAPKEKQTDVQVQAREKLRIILDAIGKDPLSEEFHKSAGTHHPKLGVICDGQRIEYTKYMTTIKKAVATMHEKDVKVKILSKGAEVHADREVPRKPAVAVAALGVSEVKVKVIADGEEVSVPDTSKFGRSTDVREVTNQFIPIGQRDLEASDTMVRFLFARPGRVDVCARCAAYRRNMLMCRVRRAHAKEDFDWGNVFGDIESIDSILHAMKTGTWMVEGDDEPAANDKAVSTEPNTGESQEENKGAKETTDQDKEEAPFTPAQKKKRKKGAPTAKSSPTDEADSTGNQEATTDTTTRSAKRSTPSRFRKPEETDDASQAETRRYSTRRSRRSVAVEDEQDEKKQASPQKNDLTTTAQDPASPAMTKAGDDQDALQPEQEEEKKPESVLVANPEECLAKAEAAFELSKIVLEEAKKFAEAPPRLSKEFLEAAVPIDSEDGHYIYCIICGLSGDLLCCDGCANVVHRPCIGLETVPENEWYCEECNMKKSESSEVKDKTAEDGASPETEQNTEKLPFGRFNFDQDRADRLTELVQELHSLRPDLAMKREKKKEKKQRKAGGVTDLAVSETDIDPSDPIAALPQTAQRFLCSIGISNYSDFLATRTYVIADKFGKWRKKNGLPELKGSGTTAYVSQWKSRCRNDAYSSGLALPEQDAGIIYKDDDDSEPESDDDDSYVAGKRRRKRKAQRSSDRKRSRPKKHIENPLDVLSQANRDFLGSIGIRDAQAFLEMRTTDLATQYVKWRRRNNLPKLKGSGETATISAWKTLVRNIEPDAVDFTPRTPKKSKKRSNPAKTPPTVPPPKVGTAAGRAERAKKRKDRAVVSEPTGPPVKKEELPVEDSEDWPPFENPLDALSATARHFLEDEGIETVEDFLSIRSGEAGVRLGLWRKKMGMPPLRGSGLGATIGAWKTICRKAVASLERYREFMANDGDGCGVGDDNNEADTHDAGDQEPAVQTEEAPRRAVRQKRGGNRKAAEPDEDEHQAANGIEESAAAVAKELIEEEAEEEPPRKRLRRSRR